MSTLALPANVPATPIHVALWGILNRRRAPECWDSTESLAARLGRSKRTIQLALKRFRAAGAIEVRLVRSRTGPGSASGHRIILRAGPNAAPETPLLGATGCAERAQPVALRSAIPSDSPLKEPEGALVKMMNDDDRGTAAGSSSSHRLSSHQQRGGEEAGQAQLAAVAELEAKAERTIWAGEGTRDRVRSLARSWGLPWVDAALDAVAEGRRNQGVTNPWKYLAGVLRNFRDEGGPPPPRPRSATENMTDEEYIRHLNVMRASKGWELIPLPVQR